VGVITSQTLSFAALLGSQLIRVQDGYLSSLSHRFGNYDGSSLSLEIYNARVRIENVEFNYYSIPIGDKRVDDCTIEELLFAVKHQLTK